jgi:hypothetical protein
LFDLFMLAFVLSVLRITESDYTFGIFKFFFPIEKSWKEAKYIPQSHTCMTAHFPGLAHVLDY